MPIVIMWLLPKMLIRYSKSEKQNRALLYVACSLFFISWYLPSPLIDGQDTSFVAHFIGGGIFTGLVWIYIKRSLRWSASWYIEALTLFALVSALGNLNELFELFMVKAHFATILITDTSWDILANTIGALITYLGYMAYDCWGR